MAGGNANYEQMMSRGEKLRSWLAFALSMPTIDLMRRSLLVVIAVLGLAPFAAAQTSDTEAPELELTTPPTGTTLTSRKVVISGTVTDNVGVTEVRYRVEGSRKWRKAVLTNEGETSTTFVFRAKLQKKGHSRVYVRATDAAGNESDTAGRKYIIDPNFQPTTDDGGDNGNGNGPGVDPVPG